MAEIAASSLSTFITNIGTVMSGIGTWMSVLLNVVVENPVLLVPIGIGLAGGVIGLFHSLKN